jgi:hypothetical protein
LFHPPPAVSSAWYLTTGVTAANVIAAWRFKGAVSEATSLVNLANPGTYDLTATGAPTWDAVNGWTLNAGNTIATSGLVSQDKLSILIQYSDGSFNAGYAEAVYYAVNDFILFSSRDSGDGGPYYSCYQGDGATVNSNSNLLSGNLGVSRNPASNTFRGYINGLPDIEQTETLPNLEATQIILGMTGWGIKVQAAVVYSIPLTASQVATIAANMAAL